MNHQRHCFQSSGWTAHQHVTGHIFTGYDPKCSGSGGGAILLVLTYLCGLLLLSWSFILCVSIWCCIPSDFKEILVTPLFETSRYNLQFYLLKRFAIIPYST